jgi:hypothetical protein
MKGLIIGLVASLGATTALAQSAAALGAPPATYPPCTKPGQDRCVVTHHAGHAAHLKHHAHHAK